MIDGNSLRNACSEALKTPGADRGLLEEAWACAIVPEVGEFARYFYSQGRDYYRSGVVAERLHGGLLGILAAALAVQAARRQDFREMVRWVHETAAGWGGTRPTEGLAEALTWVHGLEPALLLDEHFKALSRLAPGQWMVGAARDCVHALLEDARKVVRERKVPVLGVKAGQGFLAGLKVELVADGTGEFYPDPNGMGLTPLTSSFLKAVDTAWKVACGLSSRAPTAEREHGPGRRSGFSLAEQIGAQDVRWRVEGCDLFLLSGESLGLAMTVALVQLLRDEPLDPQCAVTGAVAENEDVLPVNHVTAKVAALAGAGMTKVVVPRPNEDEARHGWPGSDNIAAVSTVEEALEAASGVLKGVCDLLRWQIERIENECQERTGRPLEQQFVAIKVARGARPKLKAEVLEEIERRRAQGNWDGAEKLMDRRDDMHRDPEAQGEFERSTAAWEDVRKRLKRGVILGDPGFGKTMLLWYEVRRRCQEQLDRVLRPEIGQEIGVEQVVPGLFLSASMLGAELQRQQKPLIEALVAKLKVQVPLRKAAEDWIGRRLQQGQAFLAVDSLEEVPAETREAFQEGFKSFSRTFQGDLLVSSRPVNYTRAPLEGKEATELELLAFDNGQMNEAVKRWFGEDNLAAELLAHLRRQPSLWQTLRSPLLLRLACQVAGGARKKGTSLRLWENRTALYEEFLHHAVTCWEERTRQKPTPEQRGDFTRSAAALAWSLWQDNGNPAGSLFTEKQLSDKVRSLKRQSYFVGRESSIQDLCDAGLLTRAGPSHPSTPYLFTHRTFQEYLVACSLAQKEGWLETALDQVYDRNWQEVLQFLGGTLDRAKAREYVAALLRKHREDRDLFARPFRLGALAAAQAPAGTFDDGFVKDLVQKIVDLSLEPPRWLGRPDFFPLLSAWSIWTVPILLHRLSADTDARVRAAAAEALGRLGDVRALEALLHRLSADTAAGVRAAAAEALGRLGDRGAVEPLLHRLAFDASGDVRWAAAAALGELGDVRALEALLDCLSADDSSPVRAAAAAALGRLGDVRALEALRHRLSADTDEGVRTAAAAALGRLGDRGAVEPLLHRLAYDASWYVRGAAAAALGELGDVRALEALLDRLTDDHILGRVQAEAALKRIVLRMRRPLCVPQSAGKRKNHFFLGFRERLLAPFDAFLDFCERLLAQIES